MANPDHVAHLKRGAEHWTAWRQAQPGLVPDLAGLVLAGVDLQGFELAAVDARGADWSGCRAQGANFSQGNWVQVTCGAWMGDRSKPAKAILSEPVWRGRISRRRICEVPTSWGPIWPRRT